MSNESDDTEGHSITDVELSLTMPIIEDTSPPCVSMWMDKMNKGILSNTHFKEHWRVWVPKIYRLEPTDNCLEWVFDEKEAQKVLYDPLEEFICNGNPSEVLKQLTQMDRPPSICGRVFKNGEPTYSCRECGMDSTCVLCVDCFKQSAHKNHKYKMGISIGGGCCDCGDTEAWKKEPFCKIHLAGIESKDTPSNKLADDMAERAAITFQAVLKYCYDLLSMEHSPGLPADLCVKDANDDLYSTNDTYCTVLFNDESHTFDQVIITLTRIIKCSHRDATEYVTNIDREGRAVVKCSDFHHCNELKQEIEKFTSRHSNRPLKVLVEHAHVVAHQIFAMKLLGWLQQFISHCEGFRVIFSQVVLNAKPPDIPILKGILLRDYQLWKLARTCWHRLFISGMLTEYENKKSLAIVFTQNYGTVLKDFIRDDHDHPYSIASMSVQLFTVPTLAHLLIAQHDALFLLLNTFISESQRKCNALGKLQFERNIPNNSFKRAHYILYDLRYLLSARPETWTNELRRGFLLGMQLLMQLLSSMQWMDAVVRQVGQHMEYEQEWESAFNLQIKLSSVISLALEWCGSDRVVLIKAMRLVLKKLEEQPGKAPTNFREVASHSASCIHYDVATEPVSIHLPLSRFLAGLFLHLEKYELSFQGAEITSKSTVEELIEPVLRARAMISQVQAHMWRRNGYSLIHQLFFYHNFKCRTEMLDKDIVLLQAGAALIESNEFIIHILNKFNLVNWSQPDFESALMKTSEEDSIRQTINLVEEFLELLIIIVGERYMPGVGQVTADDCLKHEIIQQLCINPMSHSELNKTLPDGVHHEAGMERVINEIADFVKPQQASAGKGVYKLKPELYSEYNVFFYHYTKEELSKSEEAQRKRRKANNELECCPPPRLPRLTEMFNLVTNLLQCDVMLSIMSMVLTRTLDLKARSFSEAQVHKVMHLIGYALQEQESGYYPYLAFTERAAKWNIYKLLENVYSSPRIESHKDLLTWVLEKYRQVAGSSMAEVEAAPSTAPQTNESEDTEKSEEKGSQEWRMKMAAKKRAQVMAQMAAMQKHFMNKNAELFEEAAALDNNSKNECGSAMDLSEGLVDEAQFALGRRQSNRFCFEKSFTCILCQEDQAVKADEPALVLAAFVQQSTVLCQQSPGLENPRQRCQDEMTPLFLSSYLGASPHASTCGHVMHAVCWQKYFDNVLAKENRRPYRLRQPASFDVEKHEYLCPLCECLSNTVMPLLPSAGLLQPTPAEQPDLSFDQWLDIMNSVCKCRDIEEKLVIAHDDSCRYCTLLITQHSEEANPDSDSDDFLTRVHLSSCPLETVRSHGAAGEALLQLYSQPGPRLSDNLVEMIELFTQTTYTKGLGCEPHDGDSRVPQLAWKATAYTVHAIEFLLRETDKPLLGALSSRQRDSLEGLARMSAVIGATWPSSATATTARVSSEHVAEFAFFCLAYFFDSSECRYSILTWDPFGLLVTLLSSMANLLSTRGDCPSIITGNVAELHATRLVFTALVVKILLLADYDKDETMDVDGDDEDEDEDEDVDTEKNECVRFASALKALSVSTGKLSLAEVWKQVKECCKPFLRCCVLYFHYVTDVSAPVELTEQGGATFENMCRYLALPETCEALFDSDKILQLAVEWSKHISVTCPTSRSLAIREPLKVNRLVDLPEDYSELMNTVSMFTCPHSDKEDSRNPTMCLVCGDMLCSQSYCCQIELVRTLVGACTYHAHNCGAGVGIFLRVRDCEIIFLRSPNRGCYGCPPYLDEYGETDQGLHRGNPLKLCKDKYQRLNEMWLSHGLYETIARAIETSNNAPGQWQHL